MTLEAKMTRHKQRYFGHIKRTNDAIGKKIMPGKMEGNRGRPCTIDGQMESQKHTHNIGRTK